MCGIVTAIERDPLDARKGGFDHYMLGERYEQSTSIALTIQRRVTGTVRREDLDGLDVGSITSVHFLACCTSQHLAVLRAPLKRAGRRRPDHLRTGIRLHRGSRRERAD